MCAGIRRTTWEQSIMTDAPIRIAIVGAGIFAHDVHLPAIQSLSDRYELVAVCSRTAESAQKLADAAGKPLDITTDYDALLARDDIDAIDVVVTINLLPDFVEKALASGKHV